MRELSADLITNMTVLVSNFHRDSDNLASIVNSTVYFPMLKIYICLSL